jgi:hypothetical protein
MGDTKGTDVSSVALTYLGGCHLKWLTRFSKAWRETSLQLKEMTFGELVAPCAFACLHLMKP